MSRTVNSRRGKTLKAFSIPMDIQGEGKLSRRPVFHWTFREKLYKYKISFNNHD